MMEICLFFSYIRVPQSHAEVLGEGAKTSNQTRLTVGGGEYNGRMKTNMAFNFVMMFNLATRRKYLPFVASFFGGKYR